MRYQANIVFDGENILSCYSDDDSHLVAWVLTRLENKANQRALGVIRDNHNTHNQPRVFTANNPHYD